MPVRIHLQKLAGLLVLCSLALPLTAAPASAEDQGARSGQLVGTLPEGAHPGRLAVGSDGTVWFSGIHTGYHGGVYDRDAEGSFIGHLPLGGKPAETTLGKGTSAGPPVAVPGGDVWFPESHKGAARKETFMVVGFSLTGPTQSYVVGDGVTGIRGMATMGGDLWFSGSARVGGSERGVIGRVALSAAGAVTLFPLPPRCGAGGAIAATADAVWFGETCMRVTSAGKHRVRSAHVGRVDASGAITRLPLPRGDKPIAVATDPDGSVWIGMQDENFGTPARLVRVEATGSLERLRVPGASFYGMAVGPEGRLWFSSVVQSPYYDGLGSVGPGGDTSQPICTVANLCSLQIAALTTGPEGTLWFTAGLAPSHGIGGGGGSHLLEDEALQRAPGYIGRVQ
jgi:streptogramin lyase